jgi:hypothetical protein
MNRDGLPDIVTPYEVLFQRPWSGPWSVER